MTLVRVPNIENAVETDEDLIRYLRQQRKLCGQLARELTSACAHIAGALKAYDRVSGKRRRGKVVRPLVLAATGAMLLSRYMALAARRFKIEYAVEIEVGKRHGSRLGGRRPARRRAG